MNNNNKTIVKDGLFSQSKCKIIPFPGLNNFTRNSEQSNRLYTHNHSYTAAIIHGRPGERLPENIPDFRPHLQRDGLILLSWDKKLSVTGALYTAYWVTSSGIHRYYASPAVFIEDFAETMPYKKSYAAEDGIEFYGDASPLYIVHVAPELMMSSYQKKTQRPEHIKKLKALGVKVNFEYAYLLSRERKRLPFNGKRGA